MANGLDRIDYPYLYGRLTAAIDLFLKGSITEARLYEIREQVASEEQIMKGRTS